MFYKRTILLLYFSLTVYGEREDEGVTISSQSCDNTTFTKRGGISLHSQKWKITFETGSNKTIGEDNRMTEDESAATQNQELSSRAKVALSIYAIFGILIIVGTATDIILLKVVKCHVENEASITNNASPKTQASTLPECDRHEDIRSDSENDLQDLRITQPRCIYWKGVLYRKLISCYQRYRQRIVSFDYREFMKCFVLCFSLYTNGAKQFNTSKGVGTLRTVNGIRFLSLTWVILGHTLINSKEHIDNPSRMDQWVLKRWTYQPMENASPSVDSFFTLSGLLVSYLTMRELRRSKGKINWLMFYFHRYFRLTAPLGMVMLFIISVFEYLGNGPDWKLEPSDRSYCQHSWWKTILYVGNLDYDEKEVCIGITWYIANDMQFYVLSPIILIPLYFRPRLGILVWSLFLFTTVITAALIARLDYIAANFFQRGNPDQYKVYYMKPYTRMGPYLIGILAGYILHRTGSKLKLAWYTTVLAWSVAISIGLAVIYGLVESDQWKITLSWDVSALYVALNRTAWGIAVSWVVIACTTENGGFINTLLSWPPFVFLSRCSYMAYLLSDYTLEWFYQFQHRKLHLTDIGVVYRCLGSVSIAFLVGCVASLVMELPILNIETLIFKRERRK